METLTFTTNWGVVSPPSIEAATLIADLPRREHVFFVQVRARRRSVRPRKLTRNYHVAPGNEGRSPVISHQVGLPRHDPRALSITAVPRLSRAPFLPMLWDGVRNVPNTLHGDWGHGEQSRRRSSRRVPTRSRSSSRSLPSFSPCLRMAIGRASAHLRQVRRAAVRRRGDQRLRAPGCVVRQRHVGVVPDLLTFAKGVTYHVRALAVSVATNNVVDWMAASPLASFVHGSLGGHPVATGRCCGEPHGDPRGACRRNVVRATGPSSRTACASSYDTYDVVKEVRQAWATSTR